jgi:hypothetical protein
MTHAEVQRWLDAYVEAWKTYDGAAIGALFSQDATYGYEPYAEPLRGRDAIVASWLEDPDAAGTWEAAYEPLLIEGDRAVATGESRYARGDVYSNLFVLGFDADGRCSSFVEWYVKHPADATLSA